MSLMNTDVNTEVAAELRAQAARNSKSGTDLAIAIGEDKMWTGRRLGARVQITVSDLTRLSDAIGVDPVAVLAAAIERAKPLAATP